MNSPVSEEEYSALKWIKNNTEKGAVVMAPAEQGSLISAIAERKNVADTHFLLQNHAEQRIEDIRKAYTTQMETEALRVLNKYRADYIYLSAHAREKFGIQRLHYTEDERCFRRVYEGNAEIYEVLCELK